MEVRQTNNRSRRRPDGRTLVAACLLLSLTISACTSSSDNDDTTTSTTTSTTLPASTSTTTGTVPNTSTTTPPIEPPVDEEPTDPGFYLMLMWHQHQPLYPVDENGVYSRPWVRVHATKDYYDMAATVAQYPEVKTVFNLTPVLLLQLEALSQGAKDTYWTHTEIPAEDLTDEEKLFILERFFDTNPGIIERFPRYQMLANSRADYGNQDAVLVWSTDEFRDLQVLFNLAWTDPSFLEQEPLASLVEKGGDYSEADKQVVLDEHRRIISEVIPLHAQLWEQGQIEVTTTPLAHPILPLLSDTNLAAVGDPTGQLPENRFQEIPDADQQVIRGLDVAERLLGQRPVGMWPGEGAVSQLVMSLFSKNGVKWVATGEDVLSQSLDIAFTRDSNDTVEQSELFYPWQATLNRNPPVPMFFRDVRLSDLVGFEYSGSPGESGAEDFMGRLQLIRDQLEAEGRLGGERPPVVSVILDGENAWEHYPNDGIDFLNGLYQRLSDADWIKTITPSEYLARFPAPEPLEEVFPASWFQPNFATWIGEEEEAIAWDYLYTVRQDLRNFERSLENPEEDSRYQAAFESMLFAEGSDWFWWYGSDQSSGNDDYFDRAFRELLGQVYDGMEQARPAFLSVPIIPTTPIAPDQTAPDLISIELDGDLADWDLGGYFLDGEARLRYGFDTENLYLSFTNDSDELDVPVDIYLAGEGEPVGLSLDDEPLGFRATHVVQFFVPEKTACWSILVTEVGWPAPTPEDCAPLEVGLERSSFELAIPLIQLGNFESGDSILASVHYFGYPFNFREGAVLAMQVPDLSNIEVVLEVADLVGDDHGPGSYTYPTDGVFLPGGFDLELFQIGIEDEDYAFVFDVLGRIDNPWGSASGLSTQTFDVYIDTDPGAATGFQRLLDGRNAVLAPEHGWEYALTVEGWQSALFTEGAEGVWEETRPTMDVVVFGDKGKVIVKIPQTVFGDTDPSTWGVAVAAMSQEGFPSSGVRRVRDVEVNASQWRIGGAPAEGSINHTRIIDAAFPNAGVQEESLSQFSVETTGSVGDLSLDQFGVLPMNLP